MSARMICAARDATVRVPAPLNVLAEDEGGHTFRVSSIVLTRQTADPDPGDLLAYLSGNRLTPARRPGRRYRYAPGRVATRMDYYNDDEDGLTLPGLMLPEEYQPGESVPLSALVAAYAPARLNLPPDRAPVARPVSTAFDPGCPALVLYDHSAAVSIEGSDRVPVRTRYGLEIRAESVEIIRRVTPSRRFVLVTATAPDCPDFARYTVEDGNDDAEPMPADLLALVHQFQPPAIPSTIARRSGLAIAE